MCVGGGEGGGVEKPVVPILISIYIHRTYRLVAQCIEKGVRVSWTQCSRGFLGGGGWGGSPKMGGGATRGVYWGGGWGVNWADALR